MRYDGAMRLAMFVGLVLLGACATKAPSPLVVRGEGGKEIGLVTGNQVFIPKVGCSLGLLDNELYVPELRHIDVWWSGPNCTGKPSTDIGSLSKPVPPWEGFPFACAYSAWGDSRGQLRRAVLRAVQPVLRTQLMVQSRANFHDPLEACVNLDAPKRVQVYPLEAVPPELLAVQGPFTFGR
jgi:hypothetical protein